MLLLVNSGGILNNETNVIDDAISKVVGPGRDYVRY